LYFNSLDWRQESTERGLFLPAASKAEDEQEPRTPGFGSLEYRPASFYWTAASGPTPAQAEAASLVGFARRFETRSIPCPLRAGLTQRVAECHARAQALRPRPGIHIVEVRCIRQTELPALFRISGTLANVEPTAQRPYTGQLNTRGVASGFFAHALLGCFPHD